MKNLILVILGMLFVVACSSSPVLSERRLKKEVMVSREQFLYQVRLGVFKDQIVVAKDNKNFCKETFPEGTNYKRPVTKAEFVDCLSGYLKFDVENIVYREYQDLRKMDALFKKAQNFLAEGIVETVDENYMGMNEPLKGEDLAKALKRLEEFKNR